MEVVIAGGGIAGLATATALHQRGLEVLVLERSRRPEPGGAALSLWPNALRALDVMGLGTLVREHAALAGESGVRDVSGTWLARSRIGEALARRYGDPLVLVRRSLLLNALRSQLPVEAVRYETTVVDVDPGSLEQRAVIHTDDGEALQAEVVVAADGVRSRLRKAVFPRAPGLRYAGYTAWRMLVEAPGDESFETWGPGGDRFAVLPLHDGMAYAFATAKVPARCWYPSEAAQLQRRFGHWHEPVGFIVGALSDADVLRNDVEYLPALPALTTGRVALVGDAGHAMTPDLGQGGCQALEDAVELALHLAQTRTDPMTALARYDARRHPRTMEVGRRSRRAGALYNQPAAVRRSTARLMASLPERTLLRRLDPVIDWHPPALGAPDAAAGLRRAP